MDILLSKLKFQGWTSLFLLGDTQSKFAKPEMYKFYGRGMVCDFVFITTVRGKSIHLKTEDNARILGIPNVGWDHYVRHEWPPLDNLASTLEISRKFSGHPFLSQHK